MSTIHYLFRAQVQSEPERIALTFQGQEFTYQALDRRANQLAHYLREAGVDLEARVGICLERSPEAIVAILGTLKAGGAYVPLDPSYPQERLGLMLQDAGVRAVVTRTPLLDALGLDGGDPGGPAVVCIDRDREAIESRSDRDPEIDVDLRNLAYVIFTSGSTGRPKGVMVSHQGVAGLARAHGKAFHTSAEDRVLQYASLSFDASVAEMITSWGAGATLCLGTKEELLPGPELLGFLRNNDITIATLPPSSLSNLPVADLPALRTLIVAGEAVSRRLVDRWSGGRQFFNAYGPTETTVCASMKECGGGSGIPPIGQALKGLRIHLLNPALEPVAAGEAGEVCVGGGALARGYLDLPGLTAERFVPDPCGEDPGQRLYRTGDLARRLENGDLVYLGRQDHQVKVRGFRVEPGEVEAHLRRHPAVDEAVVVARPDARGMQQLVAYLNGGEASLPSTTELRSYLLKELPEHLIPSRTVIVESFPLTPNGKVDRAALPDPDAEGGGAAVVEPRTPLEASLLAIWKDLFGIERLGVEHGFFELGGHSLLATQIAARIRADLGMDVPPLGLFSLSPPNVARLAAAIEAGHWSESGSTRLPPLRRADRDGDLPAASGQEQVWFIHQVAPDALAYNSQATIHLHGPLEAVTLERALTEIIRRHEIYRTSFNKVDGGLRQQIQEPWPARVPVIDLQGIPRAARSGLSEALIARELSRPFDLSGNALIRWTLLRLAPEEHVLVQVEHHFVHDGWSFAVLARELVALYEGFQRDRPVVLPEAEFQFADFARWQRDCLEAGIFGRQIEYWLDKLAGSPALLELPTDRPRPKIPSFRGGQIRIDLPPALYTAIQRLAAREGVSVYVVMLTAFYLLLQRYTYRNDLSVGSAVANRRLRETEDLIGMLVNTVVLRSDLSGEPARGELLRRVRQVVEEAHENQEVPFERLVEALHPARDLSFNPLIQALFNFHDSPVPDLNFGGMRGGVMERHNGSAKFDLNVIGIPRRQQRVGREPSPDDDRLTLMWEYSTDLFDRSTMERMLEHYQNLLAALVEQPARPLASLPMLSSAEMTTLRQWAGGQTDGGPQPAAVPGLVAAQAQRQPQATAVVQGERRLTCGELEQRATRLAAALRHHGVGPEERVGVCLERSPELLVAWLAVWKAGGAYVSLDPSSPVDRLRFMLEDAEVRWLLTAPSRAQELADPRWLCLHPREDGSLPGDAGDGAGSRQVASAPAPNQLAYVIYTSGSTGRPKGVGIDHGALAQLVRWHQEAFAVGSTDRATQVAGLGFDASVWETWPYLASGAGLWLLEEETRGSLERIRDWLVEQRITVSFQPTPLAEGMMDLEWPAQCALRWLLTGGDRLHHHPPPGLPFTVSNNYGPTENTVVATSTPLVAGSEGAPAIGRPVGSTQVWVLDPALSPVPIGVPGELCIGGGALARGYLGRPARTAQSFIPDPLGGGSGARLYRTGDLVRYRPDGRLEFLGRTDQQVKIRGYRIELGEVESVIGEQPGVEACAAVVDGQGESARLVAYVVGGGETEELRRAVRAKLPDYMVPAVFVALPALPLTANGKVDRQALPAPPLPEERTGVGIAPESLAEKTLAEIWQDVLQLEQVGVNDNFFDLGGHSLLASRVASRVRETFQVELSLPTFFAAPTLGEMAGEIEGLILADLDPPVEPEGTALTSETADGGS